MDIEDVPTCSLYISGSPHQTQTNPLNFHQEITNLSKTKLEEAIRLSSPSGNWSTSQTSCGLIVTFSHEPDAERFIQRSNLAEIFNGPVQVARFSARDSRYRQSVLLRDIPWAIPLEDLSSALMKQGIPTGTIERCRQHVRIELLEAAHYELLVSQGLDFFGAATFTAIPDRSINPGRSNSTGATNQQQTDSLSAINGNIIDRVNGQNDGILQCYRCQGFWHIATNCRHLPRCVRCGEPHNVEFCPRPRSNPRCCHCSGHHHAAYRQCPMRLQLLNATPVSINLSTNRVLVTGQYSQNSQEKTNASQDDTLKKKF